jgi:indole-3-glycerol phosphate synthase/phosphoribosylanthranilate isomerase
VFADQAPEVIAGAAAALELAAVQLHGGEPPEDVTRVRSLLPPGCEVWKAVPIRKRIPLTAETGADRLLLDGWTAGKSGGSGKAFDWSLLDGHPERSEIILAGGVGAANAEPAAALNPWALDLSSSVESAPGRKDPLLLGEFFAARRRIHGRGDHP